MIGPAYMHPATAAALLRLSRAQTARLRARRELRAQLRRVGWSDSACGELIAANEFITHGKGTA